jgi:metal-responsive CopG/Arc/MetJ family transcriptional regulator
MVLVARKQVLVQLDDTQVAALDRLAVAADDSRSELIRHAIDLYLNARAEAIEDLRYADAYAMKPEDLEELAGLRALAVWPKD